MPLRRRSLIATPLLLPGLAWAQGARSISLIVPYAAGGGTDISAREFAIPFAEALREIVVVDNRGGAAGQVGTVAVARARPDGATLLYAVSTNIVVNPHLQPGNARDRIDLATALTPVAQVSSYQYVLVIDPRLGIGTLRQLIDYVKAQPAGSVTYSSGGVGNNNHLAGVLFAEAAGLSMEHVPYRGTAPALMDVVAGRVAANFSSPPPAIPLVREGRLRALAVTGPHRMAALPEVPTLAEAGLPGVTITGWHAVFAPAGTPEPILERYEAAARQAADSAAFGERLEKDGLEPAPRETRAAFAAKVREESAFWARKLRELDIRME